MAAPAPARVYDIEDYYALPQDGGIHYEFDHGVVIEVPGTSLEHGYIVHQLSSLMLALTVENGSALRPGSGVSFKLGNDRIRYPDLFLVDRRRGQNMVRDHGDYVGYPELVVEVISQSDSAWESEKKRDRFLEAGTQSYWMIYPNTQRVHVWTRTGCQSYSPGDSIPGEPLLPGLAIPVSSVFA